jgi:hypothetical protein
MTPKELKKKQDKCKHDLRNPVHSSKRDIRCPKCQADISNLDYYCGTCRDFHSNIKRRELDNKKKKK